MKSILCTMLLAVMIACGGNPKPCPAPNTGNPNNPNVVVPRPAPDTELGIATFQVVVVPDGPSNYALFVIDQAAQYNSEIFKVKELVDNSEFADVLALKQKDGTLVDVLQTDGRQDEDFFSANLCQGEFSLNCKATVLVNGKQIKWLRIVVPLDGGGHSVYLVPPYKADT